MAQGEVERRPTAVLAADVVSDSRLMDQNEEGTLAQLRAYRVELIDLEIARDKGRIVKTTGDDVLSEFTSVADTVECRVRVEVQRDHADRNKDILEVFHEVLRSRTN